MRKFKLKRGTIHNNRTMQTEVWSHGIKIAEINDGLPRQAYADFWKDVIFKKYI